MNSERLVAMPAVATRPVRSEDLAAFERMWRRLSEETIYRRFHAPIKRLSLKLRRYLVDVDHVDHDALVAVAGGEVIAVARYHRCADDPAAAEVAVLVEDAWQGRGLGVRMLRELASLASRRGIHVLTGDVQADNLPMLELVQSLLGPAALDARGALVHVSGSYGGAGEPRVSAPCA
ncbi:GNAT family N-acetyltransferase [Nocardioides sp. NPDC057772]|uniref:GNAT family N-acetyltransferase n=1 Tax=Nocardioides sp. NPDC057772 TaxID=3346245 RepID=UPI00366EC854